MNYKASAIWLTKANPSGVVSALAGAGYPVETALDAEQLIEDLLENDPSILVSVLDGVPNLKNQPLPGKSFEISGFHLGDAIVALFGGTPSGAAAQNQQLVNALAEQAEAGNQETDYTTPLIIGGVILIAIVVLPRIL